MVRLLLMQGASPNEPFEINGQDFTVWALFLKFIWDGRKKGLSRLPRPTGLEEEYFCSGPLPLSLFSYNPL